MAVGGPTLVDTNTAVDGNNVETIAVTKPTGLAEGDIVVCFVTTDGNPTISSSDSLTKELQDDSPTTAVTVAVFWRIATDSEPASYTFTWTGAEKCCAAAWGVRNIDPFNPLQSNSVGRSSQFPTVPNVVTTSQDNMIIYHCAADGAVDAGGDSPSGTTTRYVEESGGGSGQCTHVGGEKTPNQPEIGTSGAGAFTLAASAQAVTVCIGIAPLPEPIIITTGLP